MKIILHSTQLSGPDEKITQQVFNFIREKTTEKCVISFKEPRISSFYTGRYSVYIDKLEITNINKADYFIVESDELHAISPELMRKLNQVFSNDKYSIFSKKQIEFKN